MSELYHFDSPGGVTAVRLRFAPQVLAKQWHALRARLIRSKPPEFTRNEWAYLLSALDAKNLMRSFTRAFGTLRTAPREGTVQWLARPRSPIAVWLPNNVSLLGPLTLVQLSLTGADIWMKCGSQGTDLVGPFLELVRPHLDLCVTRAMIDRDSPENASAAATARLRLAFGSDAATARVLALPHQVDSIGIAFSERQSQAWIEPQSVTEDVFETLIKVFAIYGQAGCTSPATVCLIGAEVGDAREFRDRLAERWPRVMSEAVHVHRASQNVMARQLAAARGWDAMCVAGNSAVLAIGAPDLPPIREHGTLMIMPVSLERAAAALPSNAQTLGVVAEDPQSWLGRLSSTPIKRIVKLAEMHRFGDVWDGFDYFRQCFELVEVDC